MAVKYQEVAIQFLYRGVGEELYRKFNGRLRPKKAGERFESYAYAGDAHAMCGSGIECGESEINSVVLHQWAQAGIPTSGVSTSPSIERARFYALSGGRKEKGYIFKFSVAELIQAGVSIYKVNELVPQPAMPGDNEHILVANDFGDIPESAIVSIEFFVK